MSAKSRLDDTNRIILHLALTALGRDLSQKLPDLIEAHDALVLLRYAGVHLGWETRVNSVRALNFDLVMALKELRTWRNHYAEDLDSFVYDGALTLKPSIRARIEQAAPLLSVDCGILAEACRFAHITLGDGVAPDDYRAAAERLSWPRPSTAHQEIAAIDLVNALVSLRR